MRRRAFIAVLGGTIATPLVLMAQQAAKPAPRVGFLGNASPNASEEPLEAFRDGLQNLGWIEGKTIAIEYRWARSETSRIPELAAELVRAGSDIIVVSGGVAIQAARRATSSIPIVIAAVLTDPVAAGWVASLAHPGGNLTGLASSYEEIATKQVQLLTEALPGLSRLVLLSYTLSARRTILTAVTAAAHTLGLRTHLIEIRALGEAEGAFRMARERRAQAIHVLPSPFFNANRRVLVDLASRFRLPAMYEFRGYVEDGGLVSYGVNLPDMYRRAATFVDRILKGAKPGDLPIEQPTKFELIFNLKTAKALGLTIPPSLLARADQVIE